MLWQDFGPFSQSWLSIAIAFIAGIVAFFSPCILPLIPAYMSYFTGIGIHELEQAQEHLKRRYRVKILTHALLFILGFLIIFMALGLATGTLGSLLAQYKATIQKIGGAFLIFLGVHLLGVVHVSWLLRQHKFNFHRGFQRVRWLNTFFVGITFGFAWTPCIGPVLATILFLATFQGGSLQGAFLLFIFGLGLVLPFLLVAFSMHHLVAILRRTGKYLFWIRQMTGILLITAGVLLLAGLWQRLITYFIRFAQPIL